MGIESELQKLNPSARVELFEVDLTDLGDTVYRFHPGSNHLSGNVVWQGETYTAWPCEATGFDFNTSGQIPRPHLKLANTMGTITALILAFNDCLGAKVTRHVTLVKYLDAVNFEGGVNADADPDAHLPLEIYYIDRKSIETDDVVEFELTAPFDVTGVALPRRQIIQNICPWRYRGAECGYTGTDYFKYDDTATVNESEDKCGKRLTSCKARFGQNAELPYGGFPGAGIIRS
jgi:lambda family phage minor tail protein L